MYLLLLAMLAAAAYCYGNFLRPAGRRCSRVALKCLVLLCLYCMTLRYKTERAYADFTARMRRAWLHMHVAYPELRHRGGVHRLLRPILDRLLLLDRVAYRLRY